MKKFLVLMMGLFMVFSLAACSENSASTGQQSSGTTISVVDEKNQQNSETSTPNNSQAMWQSSKASASTGKRTGITLTIGDAVLAAYLNNTSAAQDLIFRLPVTVNLFNSGHDYCGSINPPLAYDKTDVQYGWRNGDLAFWTAGNDFVIFHADEEKSANTGNLVIIGAVTSDIEKVRALPKSINVKIALAK